MSGTVVIAAREFRSFFLLPSGYVVGALFLLANGIVFLSGVFLPGQPATLRGVFSFDVIVLLFLCPAITMRAICEERRQGTWELLAASPSGAGAFIFGKFIASMGYLVVLLVPTLVLVGMLELYGRPDPGELAAGYLGLLLVGGVYLASGILASTVTASQTIAYLLTVFFWILIGLGRSALPGWLGPEAWSMLAPWDPFQRMQDFTIGLVDTSSLIYFPSLILFFLLTSIVLVETERRA
jgi:ABC-2 type transport system permease protein|tara:strand:+ start:2950 stop:3666 length:717 start_codon:yes stop_codon:yes gene_type:complete